MKQISFTQSFRLTALEPLRGSEYVLDVYGLFTASLVTTDNLCIHSYFITASRQVLAYVGLHVGVFFHMWDWILACSIIRGNIILFLKRFRCQFRNSDSFCEQMLILIASCFHMDDFYAFILTLLPQVHRY